MVVSIIDVEICSNQSVGLLIFSCSNNSSPSIASDRSLYQPVFLQCNNNWHLHNGSKQDSVAMIATVLTLHMFYYMQDLFLLKIQGHMGAINEHFW